MRAVWLLDKIGPQAEPILKEAGLKVVNAGRSFGSDTQALSAAVAEQFAPGELAAVCLRSDTKLKAEAMFGLRQAGVELIVRCGTGFDNIDLASARAQGIIIENTPGRNSTSVAEKTLLYAGNLCHKVNVAIAGQAAVWVVKQFAVDVSQFISASDRDAFERVLAGKIADLTVKKANCHGTELYGKTIGVIGYRGAIGSKVARRAMALGMRVVGYDTAKRPEVEGVINVRTQADLLPQCDFVTVHVPLNRANQSLIGAEEISLMKAFLLNLSRGGIVDLKAVETDLCSASPHLAGFASDVDDPAERVFRHPRTIVSPHIASKTDEAESNCAQAGAEQVVSWLADGEIVNGINFPDASILAERKNGQVTIVHHDTPGLIEHLTRVFASRGINIGPCMTKPDDGFAITLIGPDVSFDKQAVADLSKIEGVVRVIPLSS